MMSNTQQVNGWDKDWFAEKFQSPEVRRSSTARVAYAFGWGEESSDG